MISLPPVHLVVDAKLAILCAFLFYVQTRLTKYSESFFFQREEEKEHYRLPGGIYTTAKPRPNAYIPDDDSELPMALWITSAIQAHGTRFHHAER